MADGYVGLLVHDELDAFKSDYEKYYGMLGDNYPASADGYPIICGNYIYLSSIKAYVSTNGCGDLYEDATEVQYLKFSSKDRTAYVYFVSGVQQYVPDGAGDVTLNCYSDLDATNLLMGKAEECPKISPNNLDKYTHYRVVFEKDDKGNYIYKTVEKVDE